MTYHITIPNMRRWLDKAQLALVSKNKVRKDLWTDFGDVILFEEGDNTIPISPSEFTTIQSFLQTEGRSESLSNDSVLNWITMLHDLRKKLNKEMGIRSEQHSEAAEEQKSEAEEALTSIRQGIVERRRSS
jgi:hypothetical protein